MKRVSGSNIKAIVFDWDGVIVDSMPIIAKGIQETAKSYGVQVSVDDVVAQYTQPRHIFYKGIGVEPENETELDARHAANIAKHYVKPRLFNDVLPVLTQLISKGTKFGIASNDEGPRIQSEVEIFGLQTFFAYKSIIGGTKNKAEKIADLIAQFGLSPNELLFVGDLPSDITAAKAAGVKSAGISRHESGKARLKALKPDYFLNSLTDLLAVVGIVP